MRVTSMQQMSLSSHARTQAYPVAGRAHRAARASFLLRVSAAHGHHQHRQSHRRQGGDAKPVSEDMVSAALRRRPAARMPRRRRARAAHRTSPGKRRPGAASHFRIAPSCAPVAPRFVRRMVRRRRLFYAEVIVAHMAAKPTRRSRCAALAIDPESTSCMR